MPSGTQSYQTTSGSLIDPARRVWEDRDKTKDKIKKFERQLNTIYDMYSQGVMGAASETPMITSASDFMLESGATALPPARTDQLACSMSTTASNRRSRMAQP